MKNSIRTPTRGRKVIRLRIVSFIESAPFILWERSNLKLEAAEYVTAYDDNDTKRHGHCVIMHISRLNIFDNAADSHNHLAYTINDSVYDHDIKSLPEEVAKCFAGVYKKEIVYLSLIHISEPTRRTPIS